MPESTPEEDKNLGKWVRVDRDLNLRTGICVLITERPDSRVPTHLLPPNQTIRRAAYR